MISVDFGVDGESYKRDNQFVVSLHYQPENSNMIITLGNLCNNNNNSNGERNNLNSHKSHQSHQSHQHYQSHQHLNLHTNGKGNGHSNNDSNNGERIYIPNSNGTNSRNENKSQNSHQHQHQHLVEIEKEKQFESDSISKKLSKEDSDDSIIEDCGGGSTESEMDIELDDNGSESGNTMRAKSKRPSCRRSKCSFRSENNLSLPERSSKCPFSRDSKNKLMVETPAFRSCSYYRNKFHNSGLPDSSSDPEFWINFRNIQHNAAQRVVDGMADQQKMFQAGHLKRISGMNGLNINNNGIHIYAKSLNGHSSGMNSHNGDYQKRKPQRLEPLSRPSPSEIIQINIEK